MDTDIAKLPATTFSGRRVTRRQLEDVKWTVDNITHSSRNDLARTICEHLNWRTKKGDDKIKACLAMLETLEAQGILTLPPIKENMVRKPVGKPVWSAASDPQPEIGGPLSELGKVRLEPVESAEDRQLWNALVDRHHYLAYCKPFGSHIRYFLLDDAGRRLGCLLFEDCTRDLPARDTWVGWSKRTRDRNRLMLLRNSRFLILPWVKVKNLASHGLGLAAARLADDWEYRFKIRPVLCETFVDGRRFAASSYRAANWQFIGQTSQSRRRPPKDAYVLPLDPDCKSILRGEGKPRPKTRQQRVRSVSSDRKFRGRWIHLVEAATAVAARFDSQWQRRRRVWNSLLIILFVFRLVLADRNQGYAAVLSELWGNCLDAGVPMPSDRPPAISTASEAREKLDEDAFRQVHRAILDTAGENDGDWRWKGHRLFAVDGSKINVPRELLKNGYRLPNENSHYPQGLLSTLYRLRTKTPVDFDLHSHANERTAALRHLEHLQPDDIVVYDRGYYSFRFLHAHAERGAHAVFRIQRNANTDFDDFMDSGEDERTVGVGPPKDAPKSLRGVSHRVRLIAYEAGDTRFIIATTLLDQSRHAAADLSEMYRSRWSIEELYKSSKNLRPEFRSRSERGVKQELYANFTLILLARLVTGRCEAEAELAPSADDADAPPLQANFRNALWEVGRQVETMFLMQRNFLVEGLAHIVAGISRSMRRERPGRSYPRKSMKPRSKWTNRSRT